MLQYIITYNKRNGPFKLCFVEDTKIRANEIDGGSGSEKKLSLLSCPLNKYEAVLLLNSVYSRKLASKRLITMLHVILLGFRKFFTYLLIQIFKLKHMSIFLKQHLN